MPERIDARPVVAFAGGALLLVSLFITWYKTPAQLPAIASQPVGNAWDIFESLDLVLAGVGIAAIYSAWEQLTGRFRFGEGWLMPLSVLALVVVASQILDPPLAAGVNSNPATGAWLALGGAGALIVAGVLSVANLSLAVELESTSSSSQTTSRRRAVQDA